MVGLGSAVRATGGFADADADVVGAELAGVGLPEAALERTVAAALSGDGVELLEQARSAASATWRRRIFMALLDV
jgi:hypothetical protein